MKEAFWGLLIVMLGLVGVVIVNLFQKATVDNDRVYYLLKESTEAATYDAIDLRYYRLNAQIRIVKDKFAENLTRRFAQNVTPGDYNMVIQDVNEVPPKVSVGVTSGISSWTGEKYYLTNRVDAIIEAKYPLTDITGFLRISNSDWEQYNIVPTIDTETGETICRPYSPEDDMKCIDGDIAFVGFGSASLDNSICEEDLYKLKEREPRTANYMVCNCGTWEQKSETLYAPKRVEGKEVLYTWHFEKQSPNPQLKKKIDIRTTHRVLIDVCTRSIGIMVPANEGSIKPANNNNEPTVTNNGYKPCPPNGIRIPIGTNVTLHASYDPANSANRRLTWTSLNTSLATLVTYNPKKRCTLDRNYTNCLSKALVSAKRGNEDTVTIKAKSTNGHEATCKITIWDGSPDKMWCNDIKDLIIGESKILTYDYIPANSSKTNFTFSSNDSSIISVSGNTVTAHKGGTVTITMREANSKTTGKCSVTATVPPGSTTVDPGDGGGGSGWGTWYYTDKNGERHYVATEREAQDGAAKNAAFASGGDFGTVTDQGVWTKGTVHTNGTYITPNGTKYDTIQTKENKEKKKAEAQQSSGWSPAPSAINYNTDPRFKGSGCFIAGTLIKTMDGYQNIEDIKEGDMVLSYNKMTNKQEYRPVTKKLVHYDNEEELYEIYYDGKTIVVTEGHPIYINEKYTSNMILNISNIENSGLCNSKLYSYNDLNMNIIHAKDLKIGNYLLGSDGKYHVVTNIKHYSHNEEVYNIEVENNNNYYVNSGILVNSI